MSPSPTRSPHHVSTSSVQAAPAAAAAEAASHRKKDDTLYIIAHGHLLDALGCETMGLINQQQELLCDLSRRAPLDTDDPRETSFVFQQISIASQWFNVQVK